MFEYFENMKTKDLVITIICAVFVLVMTISFIATSIFFTKETQSAVITTFGNPTAVENSGMHFKIPWIQKVQKLDMTSQGMAIGYTDDEADETIKAESEMITSDFNFLDVFFYIEYQISDPIKYLYASENPELILSNLAQSAIRDTVGSYDVDSVLTTSRYEIQDKVKQNLIAHLEEVDIGLKVNNTTIQDVEPTEKVKAAFDAVETERQNADKVLNEAKTYQTKKLQEADSSADQIVKNAQAKKESRINEANGQVERFKSLYEEYKTAPEATKLRMYYETMESVMPNVKVVITNDEGQVVNVFSEPTATTNASK